MKDETHSTQANYRKLNNEYKGDHLNQGTSGHNRPR